MSQLKARCIEQVLTFENTPVITSGNVNYDSIVFDFCSAWDGFIKTAIFYRSENEVYHQLLDEANTCLIPNEVLTEKGDVYIGVFGVSGETTLTSQVLKYKITKGAITENLKPADPTPDIYAQIISKYNHYDERLEYFEERFNGSAGDAEFLEGHDADYFATAESVEGLTNGTTPAGDSNKLGGLDPDHFATKKSVEDIMDGTTPVPKAEDSNTLGGHGADEFFTKTGGSVDGNLFATSSEAKSRTVGLYNSLRRIHNQIDTAGTYKLYDVTNDKAIIDSTADGTNTFNGTASGNLPLTGGRIPWVYVEGTNNVPMRVYNNGGVSNNVWVQYHGKDKAVLGRLGFDGLNNPCFYGESPMNKMIPLHHDGNSAKVHIGDTAPNDTTGNVLFINTSS